MSLDGSSRINISRLRRQQG